MGAQELQEKERNVTKDKGKLKTKFYLFYFMGLGPDIMKKN